MLWLLAQAPSDTNGYLLAAVSGLSIAIGVIWVWAERKDAAREAATRAMETKILEKVSRQWEVFNASELKQQEFLLGLTAMVKALDATLTRAEAELRRRSP